MRSDDERRGRRGEKRRGCRESIYTGSETSLLCARGILSYEARLIYISFAPIWISAPGHSSQRLRSGVNAGKAGRGERSGPRRKRTMESELREMRGEGIVRSFGPRSERSPAARVICHDPAS